MNHKQLETFYWAARLGSLAKAAARLHATPSAVSMRIQELETQLKVRLFDRSQRTVHLTPEGAALLPLVEDVIRAMNRLTESPGRDVEVVSGYIRLGVIETVALTWLPEFLTQMKTRHPQVQIEVEVALSYILEEKLHRSALDMAFAPCELSTTRFRLKELEHVSFVWVASPRMAALPSSLTPNNVLDVPIIATSHEWQLRGSGLTLLSWNDMRVRHATICNTAKVAAHLAQEGLGVAYVPRRLFENELRLGVLRIVPSRPEPPPLILYSVVPWTKTTLAQNTAEDVARSVVGQL
ncbi:LysR family transcriptional regulator [Nordella sp. HKS 07]|uniref:LysR family transcriptional regulator n=1 Tax=Nordella sp. HKS 07 TaxID=2712222 RepID=UPI0013E1AEC0|nr:LysR family transcriptional regulator [Nordella sp. HKS 07]QIG50446.1 LysR family transcriptional regulator [Nordella sp. HKS 07]